MNNRELYQAFIYCPFSFNLFKKFVNFPKLTNTYKQTSTVIYNRISVISGRKKRFKFVFRVFSHLNAFYGGFSLLCARSVFKLEFKCRTLQPSPNDIFHIEVGIIKPTFPFFLNRRSWLLICPATCFFLTKLNSLINRTVGHVIYV